MLCALTVRKLKPGAFDEFREKFGAISEDPLPGWSAFHMLRNQVDDTEVVTFGYFDGTLEELEQSQAAHGYREQIDALAPLIESVLTSGVYEFEMAVQSGASRE